VEAFGSDLPPWVKPLEGFAVEKRNPDGSVRQYSRWCRACKNEHYRIMRTRRWEKDPEAERAKLRVRYERLKSRPESLEAARRSEREYQRRQRERAKTDSELAERRRETQRRWLAGVRADPERRAERLAVLRMDYRIRRERKGLGVRPRRKLARDDVRLPIVPLEPFARWFDALVVTLGVSLNANARRNGEPTLGELAERFGCSARRLYSVRNRAQRYVSADLVDRALTRMDATLVVDLGANGDREERLVVRFDDLYPGVALNVSPFDREKNFEASA
jgi:hypothetical protein